MGALGADQASDQRIKLVAPGEALAGASAEAIAPQMNEEANLRFDSARLVKAP